MKASSPQGMILFLLVVFCHFSQIAISETQHVLPRHKIFGFTLSAEGRSTNDRKTTVTDIITVSEKMKKSAAGVKSLPHYEDVCRTIIRNNFEPIMAFEKNGTLVEVQQDSQHRFVTTFVECERQFSHRCHGIDTSIYSSECVTLYEYRKTYVRRIGTFTNFVEGLIKIPIACQCKLRRKGVRMMINA